MDRLHIAMPISRWITGRS